MLGANVELSRASLNNQLAFLLGFPKILNVSGKLARTRHSSERHHQEFLPCGMLSEAAETHGFSPCPVEGCSDHDRDAGTFAGWSTTSASYTALLALQTLTYRDLPVIQVSMA